MKYEIYVTDVETTGLDSHFHDVIELSILRLSTGEQKTWSIKPLSTSTIDPGALRVNGHKLEDLTWETKIGRETYREAAGVLIEVENWLSEDGLPSNGRVLCGQNVSFDKDMLEHLWSKCGSKDSFPFGRRYVDTMVMEFMIDWAHSQLTGSNKMAEGYSLSNLVKKYGIKNEKAHSAAADVKATKEVFEKQITFLQQMLSMGLYNQDEGNIRGK